MFKKLQRLRTKKNHIKVSVEVLSLQSSSQDILQSGGFLCVCYENSGKSKSTTYKPAVTTLAEGGRGVQKSFVNFDEVIDFSATLYEDSTGSSMKKVKELTIRQRDSRRETVSVEIGKAQLNLNDVPESTPSRLSLQLLRGLTPIEVTLEIVVTIGSFDESYIPDDVSSIVSDVSFMRESSATTGPTARISSMQSTDVYTAPRIPILNDSEKILQLTMNIEKAIVDKDNAEALHLECVRDLAECRTKLKTLENNSSSVLAEKEELQISNSRLNYSLDSLRSELQDLITAKSVQDDNLSARQQRVSSLEQLNANLQAELSSFKGAHDDLSRRLQEATDFLGQGQSLLEANTTEYNAEIERLEAHAAVLNDELALVRGVSAQLDARNQQLLDELIAKKVECESLSQQLAAVKKDADSGVSRQTYGNLQAELVANISSMSAAHALADEERGKSMVLKSCLLRFARNLTPEETGQLFDAGIVLGMCP